MTGRPLRMASIGNISIVGVLGAWVDDLDPGMRRFGFNPFTRADGDEVHAELLQLIDAGRIRPHVGRVVTMDEAGAALSTTTSSAAPSAAPSCTSPTSERPRPPRRDEFRGPRASPP